ncbi:MAG: hypothetical protein ACREUD_06830 [Gammaproteobacteria bacterium]
MKAILIVVVIVITAVGGDQRLFAATNGLDWDAFVNRFIEDYLVTHPDVAVRAGRHEFDSRLPDWSPAALKKEGDWLRSHGKRAMAFNPARLDEHQRLERDYLIAVIDGNLFWLASAEWPYKNPMFYAKALDPNVYVTREYAPLDARPGAHSTTNYSPMADRLSRWCARRCSDPMVVQRFRHSSAGHRRSRISLAVV